MAKIKTFKLKDYKTYSIERHAAPPPPKRVRGIKRLARGNGDEWLVHPYPPCTKSDPTWGAEGWSMGAGEQFRHSVRKYEEQSGECVTDNVQAGIKDA